MAIIYSYPIVTPTSNDLLLGTDVDAQGKPTKNFTVQSIVDIVQGGAAGLGAVLTINNSAKNTAGANQSAIDFLNIQGTGTSTFSTFSDGTMNISGGIGTAFTSITSTDFAGNLTGIVKAGSSIEGTVTGVTQAAGDNSTKLATTAYVDGKVDPSVLQYLGDATGPFDLNLVNDDFKIAGTANQIETTATTVAANIGTITLSFPTAGVTLPDGSVATTQAAADNTTKVATDAFVQQENNAQDLDFTGDTGTSSVLLNSQTLDFEGTANQITTAVTAQKVKFTLPTDVTITGTFTGATFAGDLLGTINTATTGTTQTAGDDSTKIATTAYVDAAAGAKTLDYAGDATGPFSLNLTDDDLEFNGDSNITVTAAAVAANKGIVTIDLNNDVTISGTMQAGTLSDGTFSGSAGTYTGGVSITSTAFVGALTGNASTATALAVAGTVGVTGDVSTVPTAPTYTSGGNILIDTTIADTVVTGKVLTNLPTPTSAAIAASDTILAAMAKLQGQITSTTGLAYEGTWDPGNSATAGGTPDLRLAANKVNGHFYICSAAGIGTPNGDGTTPNSWAIGDWVIYVSNGSSTDEWQKLDQSNEVLGSGAANKIAKWTATNTLGTGLIEDNGTTVTVGNSGNLTVEGNTTLGDATTDTTTIVGPVEMQETARFNVGISLGAATYGTAGQVLTSGGGAAAVNTWTTPSTGTVESVTAGTGITIGGTAVDPTVAIDYLGTDNAILSATQENGIATTDIVWFSDVTDNNIKKTTVANLLALDGARSLSAVLAVGNTSGANNILMADSQSVNFGAGNDLIITHDGTNSIIGNVTGNLYIRNDADDADIVFQSDDGSGGRATYFQLDGSLVRTSVFKDMRFNDDVVLQIGTSADLRLSHDATDSTIDNRTGNLILEQNQDDGDIIFKNDNGSGGVTEYFRVDGGAVETRFSKSTRHFDNVGAYFGDSADLQIYHDGSNSYINEAGTGDLVILSNTVSINNAANSENIAKFIENGAVELYYDNEQIFETTSTGINIDNPGGTYSRISLKGSGTTYGTVQGDSTNGLWLRSGGTSLQGIGINGYNTTFFGNWGGGVAGTVMKVVGFTPKVEIGDSTNFGNGNLTDLEVWGDVDVKGSITSGSSGVSSVTGRKFAYVTKALTTAGGWTDMFSISGVFIGVISEVFAQCNVYGSITKSEALSYNVAQAGGTSGSVANTPVYNKIIDTGPGSAASFELQFLAYNASNNKHGYKCQARALTANSTVDISVNWMDSTVNSHTFADLT